MLLIPAIDLRSGRCVRLYQGDFAAETRYPATALELLHAYRALGAAWLHVVDLDGARDGAAANRALILELVAGALALAGPPLRLQVGGGVRSPADVAALLDAGVARVVIGSAALEQPAAVLAWLERFGSERLCLAFDVRLDESGDPRVHIHGWRQRSDTSLWEALRRFPAGSLRHVLCTDIGRDGALAGPNLSLYADALTRFPELAWQASGGVRDAVDLAALARTGVAAAVSGTALLEQRLSAQELRPFLPDASSPA